MVDRSTKPDSLKALNTGTGWGGKYVFVLGALQVILSFSGGYRPVHIPADTAIKFEELASANTRRNVETCGILAGKLVGQKMCR